MPDDTNYPPQAVVADLWARLDDAGGSESLSPGLLAAYLDGGLDDAARTVVMRRLAAAPAELLDVLAGLDHLDGLAADAAPRDLVDAAIARAPGNVTALRPRAPAPAERFLLLAAASERDERAILCRSQSGIWTLEIFVATDEPETGYLLLSVHPDHRETYEGRTARVFTQIGNEERVLADEIVRNGEIYTPVSLAGLDLRTRDAINVTFGSPP